MIKVGLLGEDPNDTSSIKNLLLKKYKGRVQFYPLLNRITGYQLDNSKIEKSLRIEFQDKGCRFILYIRDLDGFKTQKTEVEKRLKWFNELDASINKKGILLLNIWELEALILADIETFNKLYKTSHSYPGDPMVQKEPKEELKRLTYKNRKKYKESHCPDIFNKLDFNTVEKNCSYFKEFIAQFDQKLKAV